MPTVAVHTVTGGARVRYRQEGIGAQPDHPPFLQTEQERSAHRRYRLLSPLASRVTSPRPLLMTTCAPRSEFECNNVDRIRGRLYLSTSSLCFEPLVAARKLIISIQQITFVARVPEPLLLVCMSAFLWHLSSITRACAHRTSTSASPTQSRSPQTRRCASAPAGRLGHGCIVAITHSLYAHACTRDVFLSLSLSLRS
jgi:hypothetical protein